MEYIPPKPEWQGRDRDICEESQWLNRRDWLRWAGQALLGTTILNDLSVPLLGQGQKKLSPKISPRTKPSSRRSKPWKNPAFQNAGRPLSQERLATTWNNFYEFSLEKGKVHKLVHSFKTSPWAIEIKGLLKKPGTYGIDDLFQLVRPEERIYRFRCVEAWAMTVPWTGIPLGILCKKLGVSSKTKYVRFVSFNRPKEAPGFKAHSYYPWPYHEALRMDEAMNELTLLGTGIYGKPLPKQNGAPLRLIVPWKYGLKNIKSIVEIEFLAKRPNTFWHEAVPKEYSWLSNVDPKVPHPRWSQAMERLLGSDRKIQTLPFNGYGSFVADLYKK
jgi:sulfoxide reductase catalytic subunit YedY